MEMNIGFWGNVHISCGGVDSLGCQWMNDHCVFMKEETANVKSRVKY